MLPPDYTFVTGDNGQHVFSVTLDAAGSQTVTATSSGISGSVTLALTPATVSKFAVTAPAVTLAGNPLSVVVIAEDTFGNTVTGYTGTIHFSSTDGNAALPADYTFTSGPTGSGANNGIAFFGLLLRTAGLQTVTATDKANNAINGTSRRITVTPLAANHFAVSTPLRPSPALPSP